MSGQTVRRITNEISGVKELNVTDNIECVSGLRSHRNSVWFIFQKVID